MPLKPDTLLQGGKYRIIRYISAGGFGCTYEAVHTGLKGRVAIKEFFVSDICNRDEATGHVSVGTLSKRDMFGKLRGKFIREAQSVFALSHPGIVHVSDVFEENGTAYFVMDYIDGCSLADMVKKYGPMDERRALAYMRQVCAALDYVHANLRLHLDIKPGNIMVDRSGRAILIDFGASKQYDIGTGENGSTLLGYTPGFAPPEQMTADVKKFLPATDVYALGATLYNLLTGEVPMPANLRVAGEDMAPLPPSISAGTRRAVDAALQLSKWARPQSVMNFSTILFPANTPQPVPVTADTGNYNGHEWIDLGLSVKWATCNVGASSPTEHGNYYAWGETRPKNEYTRDNCATCGKNMGIISGKAANDAARVNWGSPWRLPTLSEIDELLNKCIWQWTGSGYRVTSKINGKSIFLPAAGWCDGSSISGLASVGYYWSGSPYESDSDDACGLGFGSDNYYGSRAGRYYGGPIRPVAE